MIMRKIAGQEDKKLNEKREEDECYMKEGSGSSLVATDSSFY